MKPLRIWWNCFMWYTDGCVISCGIKLVKVSPLKFYYKLLVWSTGNFCTLVSTGNQLMFHWNYLDQWYSTDGLFYRWYTTGMILTSGIPLEDYRLPVVFHWNSTGFMFTTGLQWYSTGIPVKFLLGKWW